MPEEQDVHADHDGYEREHVKHDACLPSHRSTLLLDDRVAATSQREDHLADGGGLGEEGVVAGVELHDAARPTGELAL